MVANRCNILLACCKITNPIALVMHTTVLTTRQRLMRWLTKKQPASLWIDLLRDAKTYEEWEEAAFQLDVLLGNDLW